MSVTTSTNPNALWNAIIALIAAQMTPTGTLPTVKDVRKSAQFATDTVPAIAVQWMGLDAKPYSNRTRLAAHHFRLSIAANSTGSLSRVANLDDAFATLLPIIDDGAGNGVVPMFSTPANFGLGGIAQETMIVKVDNSWEIREGANQEIWAYSFVDLDAVVQYRSS